MAVDNNQHLKHPIYLRIEICITESYLHTALALSCSSLANIDREPLRSTSFLAGRYVFAQTPATALLSFAADCHIGVHREDLGARAERL